MSSVELYSAALCPYAHRTRLTLTEKGIPFTLHEIDLLNKPANFKEISPYGKVPVLKHGEHLVWESAIINEYLEEVFPSPALMPQDPMQRAQARIWINFADTRLYATTAQLLYGSLSHDAHQQSQAMKILTEQLQFIDQEGLRNSSAAHPYWLGSEISLVDLTYYPWFEQVGVLGYFRGFQFPTGLERLERWWREIENCTSVQMLAKSSEVYIEGYSQFDQARKAQLPRKNE
jgi:glutathione S-transferase